jgi:hypothetical protein
MYSDKKFKKRPLEEVVEDLDMALDAYGSGVRTIFLADGNTAALPTNTLVAIGEAARERFRDLERITMYGSARFLVEWIRRRPPGHSTTSWMPASSSRSI